MSPRNKLINNNIINNISHNSNNEDNVKQMNTKTNSSGRKNKLSFWMRKIILSANINNNNNNNTSSSSSPVMNNSDYGSKNELRNSIALQKSKNNSRFSKGIENNPLDVQLDKNSRDVEKNNRNYDNNIDSDLGSSEVYTTTTNLSIKPIFHKDDLNINTVESISNNTLTTMTNSIKKLQWDNEPERCKTENITIINNNTTNTNTNNTSNNDISSMIPMISFYSASVRSPSIFSDINSIQSTRPTVMSIKTMETNSSVMAIPPASIIDRARPTSNPESSIPHSS